MPRLLRINLTWLKAHANVLLLQHKRLALQAGTLILLVGVGVGGYSYYSMRQQELILGSQQDVSNTLSPNGETFTPDTLGTKLQAEVGGSEQGANTTQGTDDTRQPNETDSAPAGAFLVEGISLNSASVTCREDGSTRVSVDSATVTFAGPTHQGGTLHWFWEINGVREGMSNTQASQASSQTILADSQTHTVEPTDPTAPLYIDTGYPAQEFKIRLHITGPNDATSDWLTVPAGSPVCTP